MAELHELRPAPGSHRTAKRKGRGPGSGKGKTAGRGQDGQNSRSGGGVRAGFEGGQMPLQRRIPKRGFTPRKRHIFQIVNVGDLARVEGTTVNAQTLRDAGLIRSTKGLIKVLAMGEATRAYSIEAHKFSGGATAKIESAGGSIITLGPVATDRPTAKTRAKARSQARKATEGTSVVEDSAAIEEAAEEAPAVEASDDVEEAVEDESEVEAAVIADEAVEDESTDEDEDPPAAEDAVDDAAEEEVENDG